MSLNLSRPLQTMSEKNNNYRRIGILFLVFSLAYLYWGGGSYLLSMSNRDFFFYNPLWPSGLHEMHEMFYFDIKAKLRKAKVFF